MTKKEEEHEEPLISWGAVFIGLSLGVFICLVLGAARRPDQTIINNDYGNFTSCDFNCVNYCTENEDIINRSSPEYYKTCIEACLRTSEKS